LFAGAAQAADMPSLPPVDAPPIEEAATGWYLRGDIGMSNQRLGSLTNALDRQFTSVNTIQKDFDSAPLFSIGVGYQWNSWLRTDVTGEYRGKATFHGFQITNSAGTAGSDEYRGSGDALSGDIVTYTGVNQVYNPMEFNHITSHDVKFGVRWLLEPPASAKQPIMLPPLMRRG
jgi:opacity protein-like surface antigen